MSNSVTAYDFDGVVYAGDGKEGPMRPSEGDFIVTGRSWEEAQETNQWLHSHGIYVPVYYRPGSYDDLTVKSSRQWKAHVLAQIQPDRFIEDNEEIAEYIRRRFDLDVIHCTKSGTED